MALPPFADLPALSADFSLLRQSRYTQEATAVSALLGGLALAPELQTRIQALARQLILQARDTPPAAFADFLQTYRISTQEGRVLLTMAEALLRIPDAASADALINDLLTQADWSPQQSSTALVQWAARSLALSRRFVEEENLPDAWHQLLLRLGDAVFRRALAGGVQLMARQFVQGETMRDALGRREPSLRYSYDRLGEAAQTPQDAEQYFRAYQEAIDILAEQPANRVLLARDGISVKLSALHPRLELAHWSDLQAQLQPRLLELGEMAAEAGIPLTVDAEEAERLELTLALWQQAAASPRLRAYGGLGLAVQAYQLRAPGVINYLSQQARQLGLRIPLRLVKGAYWDSEIKRAQQLGLAHYPVYTRKTHTDLAYLACARQLLLQADAFYPQFASHNAHTLAWLHLVAGELGAEFETQRLTGMGEALHEAFARLSGRPLRVYAPIGSFQTLLPYLVRRLLENGSSQSFVNQLADPGISADTLAQDPQEGLHGQPPSPHPRLPLPAALFQGRPNSPGLGPADAEGLQTLQTELAGFSDYRWQAAPLLASPGAGPYPQQNRLSPADTSHLLGTVQLTPAAEVAPAYTAAAAAFPGWAALPVGERAQNLRQLASLLRTHRAELLYLLIHEGGKTWQDALNEWRETFDFCHYYAAEAERLQGQPQTLAAISGEANSLGWHGRGVFLAISPWNFPLAIFAGQLLAALVSGNTVLAKPASQTPLIAHRLVELAYEAGIPRAVLQLLPGSSAELSQPLLTHPALGGVVFTGSTETARHIAQTLAGRPGALLPLIAETGGLNAMIADSSALPEQLVTDILASSFNSAGQRCSALRVLFLQEDIEDTVLKRLKGALDVWQVGHPSRLGSDMGPVIDQASQQALDEACEALGEKARWLASANLPASLPSGHYLAPHAFLLKRQDLPTQELFGPLLAICSWPREALGEVIDTINGWGYGLTLGIHSRIDSTIRQITAQARVGNIYVNRNQIGAVVGCQPFGGEGLSGTGFKAGGPHYLLRFMSERVITSNLSALGVNTSLLNLDDTY